MAGKLINNESRMVCRYKITEKAECRSVMERIRIEPTSRADVGATSSDTKVGRLLWRHSVGKKTNRMLPNGDSLQ